MRNKLITITTLLLIFALLMAPIVLAHHNTVEYHADCNGWEVKAQYIGGSEWRRVTWDITIDGVNYLDVWEGTSDGFTLFYKNGTAPVDVTGEIKMYSRRRTGNHYQYTLVDTDSIDLHFHDNCDPEPSPSPSVSPSPDPSDEPTPSPSSEPSPTPESSPESTPSASPTVEPSSTPVPTPTSTPQATSTPSVEEQQRKIIEEVKREDPSLVGVVGFK